MRGGPIDLTPFGAVLIAIGWVYWLVAAVALLLALKFGRTVTRKLVLALIVVLVFGFIPGRAAWHDRQVNRQAKKAFEASMALFEERCKTAGEKIERTVENVDGIVWMKWREEYSNRDNFADQWKLNDPFGRDCGLEGCIERLLRVTSGQDLNPEAAKERSRGYAFVETIDPRDGERYRYRDVIGVKSRRTPKEQAEYRQNTGKDPDPNVYGILLVRDPIQSFSARYGVVWDDISTREDREHWIAGGSVKVIDLQTNQAIAEKIGYMIDRGQGSQAGRRSPWLLAEQTACPLFREIGLSDPRRSRNRLETREFALRVLKPSEGTKP